ncbi:MAG: hypothetical protein IJW99_01440 [Clostridia bacterium]|nr:hypothetical protein [Clostridia bacterium]
MRFFLLLFHKIRLHVRTNPLQMTVFCLGCFICTLAMVMLYGNVMPHMTQETPEKYYRSFDVYLQEPVPIRELDLTDVMNIPYGSAYQVEDIIVNSAIEPGKLDVKASRNDRIFEDYISDAAFVPDGTVPGDQLILSQNTAMHRQTETFELLGKVYFVVGVSTENYITYSDFHDLNLKVDSFRIVLDTKPGRREQNEFTQLLISKFPGCRVKNADYYIAQDRELTAQAVIVMTVLYVLLFLSLAFILYDMLQSGLYVDLIFRLHGATPRRIVQLIVFEQWCILFLFGGLACLTHRVFYENWFAQFNLYTGVVYRVQDYMVIMLTTGLLALCCTMPFAHKIVSKYSYRIKKEATVF